MNTYDLADALADEMAEQRRARRERCGITVAPRYRRYARSQRNHWVFDVVQHGRCLETFGDDDAAEAYADELARELIEQGDLTV